jgi:hypothetical protein
VIVDLPKPKVVEKRKGKRGGIMIASKRIFPARVWPVGSAEFSLAAVEMYLSWGLA